jgi:hypothetical protein
MKALVSLLCVVICALSLVISPNATAQTFAQALGGDCGYMVAGKTFAFDFSGYFNFGPASSQFPNAGAGIVTFLPSGKAKGQLTLFVGADLFRVTDSPIAPDMSSYSLQWDNSQVPAVCHGTASLNGPELPPGDFMVVVADRGNRLLMIHNELGITLTAEALPMHKGRCDNSTIRGTYTYDANGWIMPPPIFPAVDPSQTLTGFVPFAFSGAISFTPNVSATQSGAPKGSAYLKGWDFVLLDGMPTPRQYTGWYKVNPDCTAIMTLEDNIGNSGQFAINTENFILADGAALFAINTNPGTALVFTARKQW